MKRKKQILNALMVLIIAIVAVSGVMAVKNLKAPDVPAIELTETGKEEEPVLKLAETAKDTRTVTNLVVSDKNGIVTVERKGIAFEVDKNTGIKSGDVYRTKVGAEITFSEDHKLKFVLGANSQLEIMDTEKRFFKLTEGEMFIHRSDSTVPFTVCTDNITIEPKGTAFSVTAYKGTDTVFVHSGEVELTGENVKETVSAGTFSSVVKDENGILSAQTKEFQPNALSEWQLCTVLAGEIGEDFFYLAADYQKVLDDRAASKLEAQQARLEEEQQTKDNLEKGQQNKTEIQEEIQQSPDTLREETQQVGVQEEQPAVVPVQKKTCTIEIRCDTILNNMSDLAEGKGSYVPANGVILATSKVSFEEGDTVFDVLKKVCSSTDIQLEYSWTALYDSYYVEGINNLYEFDCGSESGWMYQVNGWFPNYGCSSYELNDGDSIVWCYTCKGLGADVGGAVN